MKGAIKQGGRLAVACLLATAGIRAAAAGDIVVSASNQTRTYDCAGGNAVVNGGDNVLTLKNCSKAVINGGDNQVDAGTARAITVLGSGNRVTWTPVAGRGPKVVNLGGDNVVSASAGGGAKQEDDEGEDLAVLVGREGKGQVTVSGDGTVRAEGTRGGAVEVKDGAASARAAQDIVVRENGRTETLDCAGGSASVEGNSSVLTLRACRELTVNGNGNKITVVGATTLSLYGNANEVGWTPGPGGDAPKVSDLGKKNVVTRRP